MKRKVCITGIGVINPSGIGIDPFWKNVSKGVNCITPITRFDSETFPIRVAGQLQEFDVGDYLSKRFAIKMDTFSHYACAAASLALKDACLYLKSYDPYKIGVWLGNNGGGWDICERGLFELYRDGANFVNPWQATAWFLASPQGYVTIANEIKGMSKSFVCDRASSASALYFAMRAIQNGDNDIIIAGGTEAPITPFALTCYVEIGEISPAKQDITAYRPFDKTRSGSILAEGSTILILEEKENAIKRGAKIYGELSSGSMTMDYDASSHKQFARAQIQAIKEANLTQSEIDLVFAEGSGTIKGDLIEAKALQQTFSENVYVPVTFPKSGFGHLYGASTATDIVCGVLAAKNNLIPPTPNYVNSDEECGINIIRNPLQKKINHFLVNARAREGCNVSLIVKTTI